MTEKDSPFFREIAKESERDRQTETDIQREKGYTEKQRER